MLSFQPDDPWSSECHSLRGPGRWFWQCCPQAPQPGSETAALQGVHWPDSCTPHLLTSPSVLCTHSAVLTIRGKTERGQNYKGVGLDAPIHPKTLDPENEGRLLYFVLHTLTPLPIINDKNFSEFSRLNLIGSQQAKWVSSINKRTNKVNVPQIFLANFALRKWRYIKLFMCLQEYFGWREFKYGWRQRNRNQRYSQATNLATLEPSWEQGNYVYWTFFHIEVFWNGFRLQKSILCQIFVGKVESEMQEEQVFHC